MPLQILRGKFQERRVGNEVLPAGAFRNRSFRHSHVCLVSCAEKENFPIPGLVVRLAAVFDAQAGQPIFRSDEKNIGNLRKVPSFILFLQITQHGGKHLFPLLVQEVEGLFLKEDDPKRNRGVFPEAGGDGDSSRFLFHSGFPFDARIGQ